MRRWRRGELVGSLRLQFWQAIERVSKLPEPERHRLVGMALDPIREERGRTLLEAALGADWQFGSGDSDGQGSGGREPV